ncbi:MAG TPA: hypothetical protein VGD58_11930 [Herpetosiphonaceae bacterium]
MYQSYLTGNLTGRQTVSSKFRVALQNVSSASQSPKREIDRQNQLKIRSRNQEKNIQSAFILKGLFFLRLPIAELEQIPAIAEERTLIQNEIVLDFLYLQAAAHQKSSKTCYHGWRRRESRFSHPF